MNIISPLINFYNQSSTKVGINKHSSDNTVTTNLCRL